MAEANDATIELALMFALDPKAAFIAAITGLKESQLACDALAKRVEELEDLLVEWYACDFGAPRVALWREAEKIATRRAGREKT